MFEINDIIRLGSQFHTGDNFPYWVNYLYRIQEVFTVIENKTVLEIGPFTGNHTYFLREFKPKSITLVEPNIYGVNKLTRKYPEYEVIHDDIMLFLEKPRKFDVVMCFGVLYHLHSPLYLLELIANRCDPDFILLETTTGNTAGNQFVNNSSILRYEDDNTLGNRYTVNNWKSVKMHLNIYQSVIDEALKNLGYDNFYQHNLYGVENICESKTNSYVNGYKKK